MATMRMPPPRISIHALREEGDVTSSKCRRAVSYFYPRPPRGGRHQSLTPTMGVKQFLSTPSARRATWHQYGASVHQSISIHALREEGDRRRIQLAPEDLQISIHALREEGDPKNTVTDEERQNFYPRPPRGGRPSTALLCQSSRNFYPRPPRGGRRTGCRPEMSRLRFLSTPSARRATDFADADETPEMISIHALREEGDRSTFRLSLIHI